MRRRKLKVLKAKGGMDASQSDFGASVSAPGPGDTGGAGGFDKDTRQFGDKGSSPTSTGGTPTALSFSQTTSPNNVSTGKSFMPVSLQLVGAVANAATKGYRSVKAKGENILSKQVTLPSTRDYYKTTGKQLDVMSPEGKQYLIDDKRIPKTKLPTLNNDNDNNNNISLCPDGTNPPCKTPLTQIKNPVSKPNPFLSGFRAYDDGGEVVISSNVDKDLL